MKHPALALAWHSWRLSRRWFLLLLVANLGLGLALFNSAPTRLSQRLPEDLYVASAAACSSCLASAGARGATTYAMQRC